MTSRALVNGKVWVGNAARSMAEAVAIEGGRISAVGSTNDVLDRAGPDAEVLDLGGRFVSPGFQDAHVHPVNGGLQTIRCDLGSASGGPEALEMIAAYVTANPHLDFVQGGGWRYPWFEGGNPSAAALDAVTGTKPAYLVVADGHSGWANSAALAKAGVTATTPDPSDGRIERLADGSPQGTLHEGAMNLVEAVVPAASSSEMKAGLLAGQEVLFSMGVTAWHDAWVTPSIHHAYRDTAMGDELKASVRGAIWWDR